MQAFKNHSGKVIGKVSDGIFSKRVKRSRHLLRKWDAFGIDKTILDTLVREGVKDIVIHEIEENNIYSASVKDFVEKGIVMDPENWTLPEGVELRTKNEVQDVKETQEF